MSDHSGAARQTLFRDAALDRMASPERLQLAPRIVRPSWWLLLIAAALAICAALWASVLIDVPVRVHGRGMLLGEPGPRRIAAAQDGQLTALLVAAGDQVRAGQPLAVMNVNARGPQPDSESRVVSPADGTVAEILADPGEMLGRGAPLMTLVPKASETAPLSATFYLSPAEGKRVRPGMTVRIYPDSIRQGEYGGILARVTRAGTISSSVEAIARALGSQQFAAALAGSGAAIRVDATLDRDPATPTGYRWTSPRGPAGKLTMGTSFAADIVVETRPMLGLLIPASRQLLGKNP